MVQGLKTNFNFFFFQVFSNLSIWNNKIHTSSKFRPAKGTNHLENFAFLQKRGKKGGGRKQKWGGNWKYNIKEAHLWFRSTDMFSFSTTWVFRQNDSSHFSIKWNIYAFLTFLLALVWFSLAVFLLLSTLSVERHLSLLWSDTGWNPLHQNCLDRD